MYMMVSELCLGFLCLLIVVFGPFLFVEWASVPQLVFPQGLAVELLFRVSAGFEWVFRCL